MYDELDTPAVLIHLDAMERNIRQMQATVAGHGKKLRPHVKTHKSPWIAQQQLAAGAAGIACAKLGEAEVFADHGITDIHIAYPLYGELKMRRLRQLLEKAAVRVSFDSLDVAEGLAKVGRDAGKPLPVLLEVDTGLGRCGTLPGEPTLKMAQQIGKLRGLDIMGLMTHAGHAHNATNDDELKKVSREEGEWLVATAELLRKNGFDIREVSVGASPTAPYVSQVDGVTEVRPGNYVFNDCMAIDMGYATPDDCAARALVTVVSHPAPDRCFVDGGAKTFTSDSTAQFGISSGAKTQGMGRFVGRPDLVLYAFNEEHGFTRLTQPERGVRIGDRFEVIPIHACGMMNMHDRVYGVRGGRVERTIDILARGKVR